MSTPSPNASIQRFNTDILFSIFKMNADMFNDDEALDTTLSASRVCHTWRTFMLSIPSLWAHLIDLDRIHGRADEWRCELLRRSGTALLWIKAGRCTVHGSTNTTSCAMFTLDFVAQYWRRIQKLKATIGARYVDPAQWTPFYLPAPHLESLSLFAENLSIAFMPAFHHFFGGDGAPMLRELCSNMYNSNLPAPWLQQLHSIELISRVSVSGALASLEFSRDLVSLKLNFMEMGNMPVSLLPFIELPRLARLVLFFLGPCDAGAVLLDHIQIPDSCSLEFKAHNGLPMEIVNNTTLRQISRSISAHARGYFAHHTPTKMSFRYSNTYFGLEDQTYGKDSKFIFSLNVGYRSSFPSHAFSILLSEFTLPDFAGVTELTFELFNDTSAVNHPVSESIAFMTCLPSVHTVDVDPSALRYLIHVQETVQLAGVEPKSVIPFPALKTLKVHTNFGSFSRDVSSPILEFILARITYGLPIETLDISWYTMETLPDMSCFQEANGLKVLWRQTWETEKVEYICGPGRL